MDSRFRQVERQFLMSPSLENLMFYYQEHLRGGIPFNLLHTERVSDPIPPDFFLGQEEHLTIGNVGARLSEFYYSLLDICAVLDNANTGLYYLKYTPQRLTASLATMFGALPGAPFWLKMTQGPQLVIATGLNDYYYVANAGNVTGMRIFPVTADFSFQSMIDASSYPHTTSGLEPGTAFRLPRDAFDTTWNAEIAAGFKNLPGFCLYQLAAERDPDHTGGTLVDHFYTIEHYKHLALHIFKLYLFGVEDSVEAVQQIPPKGVYRQNLSIICEDWDLDLRAGANFLCHLWHAAASEDWASWGEEAAGNLNYQLPRLIDSFCGGISYDPEDIIRDCGPACTHQGRGFGFFQTPQDIEDVTENAMELWEIVKYQASRLANL